ncbi:MAG: flagellar assembly protein FliW [Bryobacter sp.]|nr:flagellar assembly protein FliW [Bryobacter sp.]
MREILTARFGQVRYDEAEVIHFPAGLPGFESETAFLLIDSETSQPLSFLQSVANGELCFICAPTALVDPEYAPSLNRQDRKTLQLAPEEGLESLRWYAILCFAQPDAPTANLLGPVVIHPTRRLGTQSIRDDNRYSARQPLFPPKESSSREVD